LGGGGKKKMSESASRVRHKELSSQYNVWLQVL
jgi:hypothetical protein